jgi:hypothetical protein
MAVHSGRTVTESVTETPLSPGTQDTPDNDEANTTSYGRATRERSALWQCGAWVFKAGHPRFLHSQSGTPTTESQIAEYIG